MMTISEAKRLNLEFKDQKETPSYTLETILESKHNLL